MFTRIAVGRARVAARSAPPRPSWRRCGRPSPRGALADRRPQRGAAHPFSGRPVAVVVEAHRQGRPDAAAFLLLRRRGPAPATRRCSAPVRAADFRLGLARDDEMAGLLADGVVDLLAEYTDNGAEVLEGQPAGTRVIVVKFESEESFGAFYDSPDYQHVIGSGCKRQTASPSSLSPVASPEHASRRRAFVIATSTPFAEPTSRPTHSPGTASKIGSHRRSDQSGIAGSSSWWCLRSPGQIRRAVRSVMTRGLTMWPP